MFRKYKKNLIVIVVVMMVLTIIQFVLPDHSRVVSWYNDVVFKPFQSIRNIIFGIFPFSIGDFLYVIGLFLLIYTIGKWIFYISKFRKYKHELGVSVIRSMNTLGIIYIVFLLGWGGNYYKQSLGSLWHLDQDRIHNQDTTLIAFDRFLISKLNEKAPRYTKVSFKSTDSAAKAYYEQYTDHSSYASQVKPSLLGNGLQYVRIQGYYNPFTGEAQVNKNLPLFMLPFVICHEMAHQQGIAREEDANLLAYALGTITDDVNFQYSAYFNIWLYTHRRLRMMDSTVANNLKTQLNATTQEHIGELLAMRDKYASGISEYSADIYDGYLKLHHQNEGIRSYSKVWYHAWALEEKRKLQREKVILIP